MEEIIPSSESVANSILDVDDIEWTWMTLSGNDGTHSPQVTTTSDHAQVAGFELDEVHDFVGSDV